VGVGGDVAVAGCVGVNELAPGLAQIWAVTRVLDSGGGSHVWWWWWVVMMVVARGKVGWSQHVTLVMFQLQLLDLATRRRLLLIIYYYL
jgi:hypothetical protein